MTNANDTSWIDQLIDLGRDFGFDIPQQPPRRARHGTVPSNLERSDPVQTSPTTLVSTSETLWRNELADLLESLSGRVRDGSVSLSPGGYTVSVDVPDKVTVDLAIRAAKQSGSTDIELDAKVRWSTSTDNGSEPDPYVTEGMSAFEDH